MNQCIYCKKDFSNKYTLNTHIKSNKKCIETRKNTFQCIECDKHFKTKGNLDRHVLTCDKYQRMEKIKSDFNEKIEKQKIFYDGKIKTLENKILEYQKVIENLEEKISKKDEDILKITEKAVSKPTTINNSTTIDNSIKMNMLPYDSLTDSFINYSFMNSFNENHLLEGQVGVAKFVSECLLSTNDKDGSKKKLMVCTDPSRKIFKTINKNGEVSKDIEAKKLTERIYEPVKIVSNRILKDLNNYYHFLVENIGDELEDCDKEKIQLNIASEKVSKAVEKQIEIINLPKDNGEFSKHLSVSLSI